MRFWSALIIFVATSKFSIYNSLRDIVEGIPKLQRVIAIALSWKEETKASSLSLCKKKKFEIYIYVEQRKNELLFEIIICLVNITPKRIGNNKIGASIQSTERRYRNSYYLFPS